MKKMTKVELQARTREIQSKLSELNDKAYEEKRGFTEDEQREWDSLSREKLLVEADIRAMLNERELAKYEENKSKGEQMRELLRECKNTGNKREILLAPGTNSAGTSNTVANIEASGAIALTINEMIPTLHEGLGLPETLRIVTGVVGDEVWPVNTNDVEMEEVGEVALLADQALDFAKIVPQKHRVGLKVPVSNMAIDNAAFDLMGYVSYKFTVALRKYLAKKVYSQAKWSGNKGPFSGLTPAGSIDLTGNAYKSILKAVANFSERGFYEGNVTIVLDPVTEAELKATPKLAGAAAGFVVQDGLCAGYPYVTTHYINTKLSGSSLVPTDSRYIGIGYFEWLALQQHGDVRYVVDPITLADRNVTRVILNTAWSITDLSVFINGGEPTSDNPPKYPTQAFALYTVVGGESGSEL